MATTSGKTRSIDRSVSRAQRDLKSQFAFVAKMRANIWLTVAGVLFVVGMGLAFVSLGDKATPGQASFLRGGDSTAKTAQYAPSIADGIASLLNRIRDSLSGGSASSRGNYAPYTAPDNGASVSVNNPEGNPTAGTITTCSYWNQSGCVVTIEGPASIVQGQPGDFHIYGTQQVDRPCPDNPTCQRSIIWFPNILVDWGDGTSQSSSIRTGYKHNYLTPGTYTVTATATYNKQQYYPTTNPLENPDNVPTPFVVGPQTFTVTVTAAASAVISATISPESPPAGAVANNATNVEFAIIDLKNNGSTAQTINAMLVGCRDGYAPEHDNGTAAPQPFSSNKFFTINRVGGGVIAQATTLSSGREFGTMFSNANFQLDPLLRFKCKVGVYRAGGARAGGSPITIPAGGTVSVSLVADVGQMDPCTRLQLGVMAAYSGGGAGPLLSSSGMGNVMVVPGVNPYSGETCSGSSVSGGGRANKTTPTSTTTKTADTPAEDTK
jgi:hypothetical protein